MSIACPRPSVARPAGLEPATAGLEGRCSIRLSYGRQKPARGAASSMVGAEGFEPPTLCSQSRCATRLRHAPPDGLSVATARGLSACARARILRRRPQPVNLALHATRRFARTSAILFFSSNSSKYTAIRCRFWLIQSRRDCRFSAHGGLIDENANTACPGHQARDRGSRRIFRSPDCTRWACAASRREQRSTW